MILVILVIDNSDKANDSVLYVTMCKWVLSLFCQNTKHRNYKVQKLRKSIHENIFVLSNCQSNGQS